ncbi:50S ribosomal protein L20 [Patescibacteria group bacterium]|nr:50S ribosomal protein L20 [Patescibacteria group bacterium]MBU1246945.1 50S ribosomal protein L20 [Patescibacteria group bacterium]MBU1519589.1 50S ribosomal protein L20 [Patescibacteria group bacterium]MBU1730459.1 50S ribosomal protein L20 [Patescibacteria group bacterium]MBU1956281.1 50S ribosomal protein L20 [Patescibacteria group bacterium]
MTRVKRGTISLKRRRNVLKETKGFRFGRSAKERQAKEAIRHAGNHAFAHRRKKKNDFRRLWQVQISSAVTPLGLSYSKFIYALKENKIEINRKMLADLAENHTETFEKVVEKVR